MLEPLKKETSMQFIVMAKDAEDEEALNRRMAARDSHLAYGEIAAKTGEQIIAAAMLDGNDNMRGSLMIVDFPSIEDLQKWLDTEAYVTGNVWQNIDIIPCKVAPTFSHLVKKSMN